MLQTVREGREAEENIVISRPDKPPPEVALIERQPRHWANRKILSGPCTEPANKPSRSTEAFSNRGDVWREETRASPGLLLFLDGLVEKKLDLNRLVEAAERKTGPDWSWRALGLGDAGVGQGGVERGCFNRQKGWLFKSKSCGLVIISNTRATLQIQNYLHFNILCVD